MVYKKPKNIKWEIPEYRTIEFSKKKSNYCICVPVINEGARFQQQVKKLSIYAPYADIIILDGGSTDGSVEKSFLKKNKVSTLLVKTGPGKLSSQLRMGYAYALLRGYTGIITVDGNGKDGLEGIPSIIMLLDEGYDYIQGSRFIAGGKAINTPWIRHVGNRYIHAPLLSFAAHAHFTDTTNGFRGYSARYLIDSRVKPFRNIFEKYELLAYLTVRASQIGYKVIEVPVSRRYPKGAVPTKISFIRGNLDLLLTLIKTVRGDFNP